MKILVTGGAGFIGSNFVHWAMANTEHEVVVLDALTYAGNLGNLEPVVNSPRFTFIQGDICDPEVTLAATKGCEAVVHFAAETHVDRSIVGPHDFARTNCLGTSVVMESARVAGVSKVVHIGTDEVYGSVEEGASLESDPLEPRSPYSASKAGSDLIALSYHQTFGLPVVVTRCTNNFGPYQHPEKAIPLFVTNLIRGMPIPLYGDGLNVRDWLHVDDHARAIYLALTAGIGGEIYNVGAGNGVTNRVLVNYLLDHFGVGEEMVNYVDDRLGHDRRYCVDTRKINELGWETEQNFAEALEATIVWYQTNEAWWRSQTL